MAMIWGMMSIIKSMDIRIKKVYVTLINVHNLPLQRLVLRMPNPTNQHYTSG
jgi:hypothetical protein